MEAESELEKARSLFGQGNRVEAKNVLIKAVRNNPRNPVIWFGLSFCVDDSQQKKDCLEKVLHLSPDHPKARSLLEQLLIGEENLQETTQDFRVGLKPEKPTATIKPVLSDRVTHQSSENQTTEKQGDEIIINRLEQGEEEIPPTKKAGESVLTPN
jgi:tetratricopeptide (TPR) repeat protein